MIIYSMFGMKPMEDFDQISVKFTGHIHSLVLEKAEKIHTFGGASSSLLKCDSRELTD